MFSGRQHKLFYGNVSTKSTTFCGTIFKVAKSTNMHVIASMKSIGNRDNLEIILFWDLKR